MQIGYPNSEYQITKLLIEEQPKPTQQGHKQAFDHNQICGFLLMTSKAEMFSFESYHQSKNIVHEHEHVHVSIE
jgi:hypothetical protein